MSKQEFEVADGEVTLDNVQDMFKTDSDKGDTNSDEELSLDSIENLELDPEPDTTEEEKTQPATKEEKQVDVLIDNEKKEEAETEQKVEDTLEDKTTSYFEKAKSLIELGYLEDLNISLSEDDIEGTPLSKMKDLTEDRFNQIIEAQNKKKEDEIKDKYLPKEGLDEDKLRIFNILKNGGSLKEINSDPDKAIIRPYEGYDLNDQKHQAQIAYDYYVNKKGLGENQAKELIKGHLREKDLDLLSGKIYEHYNQEYTNKLIELEQETLTKQKEKEENIKKIRSGLAATLKKANFKDTVTRKLVDGATKKNSDGMTQAEAKLKEILKNPEENYEILLHLLDTDTFKETYKIKTEKEKTKGFLQLIDSLPRDKKASLKKSEDEIGSDFDEEIKNKVIQLK